VGSRFSASERRISLASSDPDYASVVDAVLNGVLLARCPKGQWSFGPLEINDFSFCIPVECVDEKPLKGAYVKVPKRRIATATLQELDEQDRRFGAEEARSLRLLADTWPIDENVAFVTMLGRIEAANVIVTRRVYGQDFSQWLRRVDADGLRTALGDRERAIGSLERVGRSLARFHGAQAIDSRPDPSRLKAKFAGYAQRLSDFGIGREALTDVSALASETAIAAACDYAPMTTTLKGLDVRNLLIEPDGRLVFLDPGAMKLDSPLADHARFAATLRLLYWGKLPFFFGRRPRSEYALAFEQAYFGGEQPPAGRIFELKELCKMWLMAHVALRAKPWPAPFKRFLRSSYVNRFFTAWVAEMQRDRRNG
jgi:hypothetical protein